MFPAVSAVPGAAGSLFHGDPEEIMQWLPAVVPVDDGDGGNCPEPVIALSGHRDDFHVHGRPVCQDSGKCKAWIFRLCLPLRRAQRQHIVKLVLEPVTEESGYPFRGVFIQIAGGLDPVGILLPGGNVPALYFL